MQKLIGTLGSAAAFVLVGLTGPSALAQDEGPAPAQVAPPAPAPVAPAAPAAPAPASSYVYQYPTGQWVYSGDSGWVWIPAGATATAVEGVPYVAVYTPAYGWGWSVSPWGWGGYHVGAWVGHPWRGYAWHPYAWRGGWGGHPRAVVRYGGGHYGGHYGGHASGGAHYGGGHGGHR